MFAGKKKEFYYLFFSLAMLLLIPSMFFADTASSSNYVTNYEIQSSGSQGQFSSSSYNITASGGVMGGSMNSTNYGITSGILAGSVETTTTTITTKQSSASDVSGVGGGGASGFVCYQAGNDNKVSGVTLLQNRFACFSGFKNTSVSFLNVSLSRAVTNAEFAATDINADKLPPEVHLPEEKTYKFLEVLKFKIPEDIEIIIKIRFLVPKEWLLSNNLNESKVALRILKDDSWKVLPTQKVSSDKNNFYFESESPYSGIFAITEISEKQIIEAATATTATTTATTTTTSPPFLTKIISKFTAPEFEGFTIAFSIFFIVLVFVLIFGL